MAVKFQYNKTSLQQLDKQLKIRERALPTIKNKESALRLEVKKAKNAAQKLDTQLQEKQKGYAEIASLWCEFDSSLIRIKSIESTTKKIAGVKIPILEKIIFHEKEFSLFSTPTWFPKGIEIVKNLTQTAVERNFFLQKMKLLDIARRKTTQKVNLYEKVQIPAYQTAIRKIKRFLEDEENLSKAAQKIVKKRQEIQEESQ